MRHHTHKDHGGFGQGHKPSGEGCGGRGGWGRGQRGHSRHMKAEGRHGGPGGGRRGGGRMFEHGAMRWLLLSLIAAKPSHGYELIKMIEARTGGTYAPSPGVIYPSLTLLEDMGALSVDAEGGKKRHLITEEGRRLLAENAEAVAHVERKMALLGGRPERPAEVQGALEAFRAAVRNKLGHDQTLSHEQVEAMATLIRQTAEQIDAL